MNTQFEQSGNNGFLIGLIAGGVLGAGLAMLFAPRRGADLRQKIRTSATDLSQAASDGLQDVATRIEGVIGGVAATGRTVRNDVADAVGRGARQVEQLAMASKAR